MKKERSYLEPRNHHHHHQQQQASLKLNSALPEASSMLSSSSSMDVCTNGESEPPPYRYALREKPFAISYRRLLSIIFTSLTVLSIISLCLNTYVYLKQKRARNDEFVRLAIVKNYTHEMLPDRMPVISLLAHLMLTVHIAVRLLGLLAIGACGKEFADGGYGTSQRRESLNICLVYISGMILLSGAMIIGLGHYSLLDDFMHAGLLIMGIVFAIFACQPRDLYSMQINNAYNI